MTVPVGRAEYILHGAALALIKYIGDSLLVALMTDATWRPDMYVRSLGSLLANELAGASGAFLAVIVAWSLPFLWLGVSLTLRRALDAGWSPWWAVLFFVPIFNYLVIASMMVLPSRANAAIRLQRPIGEVGVGRGVAAVSAGVAIGLLGVLAFTFWLKAYTLVLFLGVPAAMGLATAFVLNRHARVSSRDTFAAVTVVFVIAAGLAILLLMEGIACIVMAFPPILLAGMLGAAVGVLIAEVGNRNLPPAFTALLALPVAAMVEPAPAGEVLREVRSEIVVDAAPDEVWQQVIAFPRITSAVPWWGRAGIAYPIAARIEGSGVGAIRYCEFSTGAFVEPITVWEPGRRLSFDVVEQPEPLRELTPWGTTAPPHLDGYLTSRRGEFRLIALPNGRTRLEGSTWYTLRMAPAGWWSLLTDALIRRIHSRVLEHVAAESERLSLPLAAHPAAP